ncbi:hypothetical protein HFO91_30580 [Rhizobium leguminosarum]|uniref:hypothetical protein n=1 Tax=Rhizobium leguminosarum TaxID=384 RepID=UPI001C93C8DA|nr:hypothetical protein [Rhizobium leguminosarum]MBY5453927.1 hypothetical protein [Rhizobium leguminosarum]
MEKILENLQGWIASWGDVVFNPKKFYEDEEYIKSSSPALFFFGSLILSYILTFIVSILYFNTFYAAIIRSRLDLKTDTYFSIINWLFIAFLVVSLFFFILYLSLFFIVAKIAATECSFGDHFKANVYLLAMEPLATLSCVYALLSDKGKLSFLLYVVSLTLFLAARIWGIYAGYRATVTAHRTSASPVVVFAIGFLPSWIILNIGMVAIFWTLLSDVIVPWWD